MLRLLRNMKNKCHVRQVITLGIPVPQGTFLSYKVGLAHFGN